MTSDTAGDTMARVTVVNSATQVTVDSAITIADDAAIKFIRETGIPAYDAGGVLRTNGEKYRGKFHNFAFGADNVTYFGTDKVYYRRLVSLPRRISCQ